MAFYWPLFTALSHTKHERIMVRVHTLKAARISFGCILVPEVCFQICFSTMAYWSTLAFSEAPRNRNRDLNSPNSVGAWKQDELFFGTAMVIVVDFAPPW